MNITDEAVAAAAKTFYKYEYDRFSEDERALSHATARAALVAAASCAGHV